MAQRWLTRYLDQTVTYWQPSGIGLWGDRGFITPAAIEGRWEDTSQEFTLPAGEQTVSKAVIYTLTDLVTGGYLYLGTSTETNPRLVSGAWSIQRLDKIPSLNQDITLRKAYL